MRSPMSQAPFQRLLEEGELIGFDGEDNEIADVVDDRAERVAARTFRRFT